MTDKAFFQDDFEIGSNRLVLLAMVATLAIAMLAWVGAMLIWLAAEPEMQAYVLPKSATHHVASS